MASLFDNLLSFFRGFLSTMPSPLGGWDLEEAKVNHKDNVFSSFFSFNGGNGLKDTRTNDDLEDITGEKIQLDVLLSATNVKQVLAPILSSLNNMPSIKAREGKALINLLLGDMIVDMDDDEIENAMGQFVEETAESASSIKPGMLAIFGGDGEKTAESLIQAATTAGTGLLGFDLSVYKNKKELPKSGESYGGKVWSWANIANEYLQYSLECEIPGKNYGAMENITIENCGKLIGEYLVHEDVVANVDEVQINYVTLVLPILMNIQAALREYFKKAYDKFSEAFKEVEQTDTSKEEQEEAAAKAQEEQDAAAQKEQQEQADRMERMRQMGFEFTGSSKHIDVTLQKIAGTTSFNMTAIKANYEPSLVLADMDEIIGQPEFIEVLPEEPTTFAIDVDEDGFDIEPCPECMECDPCASLEEVFKAGIRAYRNLYIIHWMSNGNDMMKLHLMAEEMYGEMVQEIDTLGELLVEKCGTVPQLDFPCDYVPVQNYDFQTGLEYIKQLIQTYIDCIDYAYCNQDSDVQSTLDEWLRFWKKQLRYFVDRQEM